MNENKKKEKRKYWDRNKLTIGTLFLLFIIGAGIGYEKVYITNMLTDKLTNATITIELEHYMIHEGKMFSYSIVDHNIGVNEWINVTMITPNTNKLIHLKFEGSNSLASDFIFYENLINSTVGTRIYGFDKNRETNNTHSVILYLGQTGSGKGLQLYNNHMQTGKGIGGIAKTDNEWVLNPNTKYLIAIKSEVINNEATLLINWYEHEQGN